MRCGCCACVGGGAVSLIPFGSVSLEKQLAEKSEVVHATHLVVELWVDNQVEVIVNLLNLCEVLVLHLASGFALSAVLPRVREQNLVDYNVMDVDFLFGQLDRQPFRLVHREELGDAHGHEGRLAGVLELLIHVLYLGLHGINPIEHTLLDFFRALLLLTILRSLVHHGLNLVEHASKFIFKLDEFDQAFLENVGEIEQSQGMTGRRCVENDQREIILVERFHDFAETSSFIDTWHRCHQVFHEPHRLLSCLLVLSLGHTSLAKHSLEKTASGTTLIGGRVDFHGEKILEIFDCSRLVSELLIESIGQIVCGVRRNYQNLKNAIFS